MHKQDMRGLDYMPIGKRTRLQRSLREKELHLRNKRARLAARTRHNKKIFAEQTSHDSVELDDSDDEDIQIVDQDDYYRHMCLLQSRDCSPNVVVDNEAKDSDQIVERRNTLDVGVDNGCCDLGEDFQSLGIQPGSIARDGVYEGCSDLRGEYQSLGIQPVSKAMDDIYEGCSDLGEDYQSLGILPGSIAMDGVYEGCSDRREEYHSFEVKHSSGAKDGVDELCVDVREDYQSLGIKPISEARNGIDHGNQYSDVQPCYGDCSNLIREGCQSPEMHPGFESCDVGVGQSSPLQPQSEGCGDLGEGSQFLEISPGFEGGGHSSPVQPYEGCIDLGEGCHSPGILLGFKGGDSGQSSPKQHGSVSENDTCSIASSGNDDHNQLSDEDFQVDESEEYTSSVASEDDGEWKVKSSTPDDGVVVRLKADRYYNNRVIDEKESAYDEEIQRGVSDNEVSESGKDSETEPDSESENDHKLKNYVRSKNGWGSKSRRSKNRNAEIAPEPKSVGYLENVGKRKRGRPKKNISEGINSTPQTKKRITKLEPREVENIMLNTILENENTGLGSFIHSTAFVSKTSTSLPLKFRFGVQNSVPGNSEEVQDSESLFQDLGFALRTSDIGAELSFMDKNNEFKVCDSAVPQEQLCREGKHYLIHDDEIGIRCKYCSFLKLEIRHVTPDFNKNPFGRAENRHTGRLPSDNTNASNGFHLPEFRDHQENTHSDNIQGTVWELIPGVRETLYPHQQEGFEFMWRNLGGGITLNELGKPSKFGSGGCIVCHAPGTGKTRLAITFLQSFIRQYPMSRPVIIAPKSIILTWEEEFARWNIDVPFHNMNKNELSGKEDLEFLEHAENVKDQSMIRIAKIHTWAMGKGILGISYTLFEKLAGDRKGVNEKIRQILIEYPGILVLDEGHTARNDQSNIWNVLTEVKTKRKIILSGTPFQNNFEELLNTLSLVREEFGNPLLPGKYMKRGRNLTDRRRGLMVSNVDNDRRIAKLKNGMKPFVHVHKGEILKKTLRGLFHSVLLLKPSDLQQACFTQLSRMKNGLKLDHLVSIASVHPSLLHSCEQISDSLKVELKIHRKNLDSGVKIRFLFDLINLAQDEKILVFNQHLKPLKFIGKLLKSRYRWTEEKELLYMDGTQNVKQRQAFIRHFNNPKSEARVLLASTKACCEGIHLVGASRVVLLDVVWNPSVERQAISRAYRLGQKKDVFVYHLITSGTQEEDKYYCQVTKDRVSEKVFSAEEECERNLDMSSKISEDRILNEMIQNEKIKNMFAKIIDQPKADEMIDSFGLVNL